MRIVIMDIFFLHVLEIDKRKAFSFLIFSNKQAENKKKTKCKSIQDGIYI